MGIFITLSSSDIMAYGEYKTQWTKVHEDSKFTIYVEWAYKQDPVANKTYYKATQLKIKKNNSAIKVWNLDTAKGGIAVITASRSTHKIGFDLRNVTSQIFNLPDDGRSITHYSDGKPKKKTNLHWYLHGNIDSPYSPEYDWHTKDITNIIPEIDRRPLSTSIEEKSKTQNSITVTASTGFYTKASGRYRLGNSAWKYFAASDDMRKSGGGSMDVTINGLKPNSKYLVEVQFQRQHNDLWSESDSIYVTTNKPSAPAIGELSVLSVTSFSAKLKLSAVLFTPGNGYGYISYRVDNGAWVKGDASDTVYVTNLQPSRSYRIDVKVVDKYGSSSSIASISVLTLNDQITHYVKYNGRYVKAVQYIKVGGRYTKEKKAYVKLNGKWVIAE